MRSTLLAAVVAAVALLVPLAGIASAQETQKFGEPVELTGTGKNGKSFTGTYTIERFVQRGGQLYAVGDLRGKLKHRRVNRSNVRIPAAISPVAGAAQDQPPTQGACQVLNLDLGALDLNVLGLRVQLAPVHLLIEAVPSGANPQVPGGLLGDLLCGITNLLNPSANTPLAQVTRLLNALLALTTTTPATR